MQKLFLLWNPYSIQKAIALQCSRHSAIRERNQASKAALSKEKLLIIQRELVEVTPQPLS